MNGKDKKITERCDAKESSTLAASSVAQFFKENNWKIISFFPNAECIKKRAKGKQKQESDSKKKR